MEAMYYEKGKDNTVKCHLCPHNCTIKEGKVGICKVRKNIEGKLISLNYGKQTSYAYDPIEKKPLYHFYPGRDIFSIGSFGCNLNCDFCQNWEIAHGTTLTMEIEDEDILLLGKSKNSIGIAYTYNEPTISYEYIYHISKLAKEKGLKNVLVTNGFINEEPLKEILPYIDAMNIDLKSMNEDFYKKICKGRLNPVLKTIEIAAKHTHVEITTLIIDGVNSSEEEIEALTNWIGNKNREIPFHISKFFPHYKMQIPQTSYNTLIKAKDIAKKYLDYVYIGNVWGTDNNTYCPNCQSQLINRQGLGEIVGIKDEKCKVCGREINVIY
ncbi:MAG: AmmeMemoRadiSam system radical SAM enzyme [Tissierellia bacterium]|nr:AmmeMemoRadiSam system radical SAM enzyme [Tissierellia bacterium]